MGLLSRGSRVRVSAGAPFSPHFARSWSRSAESGDIPPLTATGRNVPSEILFAVLGPFLSGRDAQLLIAIHSLPTSGGPMASSRPMADSASALRELRTRLGLSQAECATALGVAVETFRAWDAGRRPAPEAIVFRAQTLTPKRPLHRHVPLHVLAKELHVHVRTLRAAARDGGLDATFGRRLFFGKLTATATREDSQASLLRGS